LALGKAQQWRIFSKKIECEQLTRSAGRVFSKQRMQGYFEDESEEICLTDFPEAQGSELSGNLFTGD
jgi:hypothetical protein